jgi:phage I-like protein
MRLHTALLAATLPLLASGQAQLLPAGEFAARDGRPGPGKSWKVTDAQGQLLADALNAITAKTPVVIDYEHQTLSAPTNGQPAPAAGWIKHATWRPGEGLFADVEWTAAARARIEAGEYRFISPVITFDSKGVITGVLMGALTNFPALLGMDAVVAQLNTLFNLPPEHQETDMAALLVSLLAAIGLPAATSEAEALAAVSALTATATAARDGLAALRAELGLPETADTTAALTAVKSLKTANVGTETVALVTTLQTQVATLTAQLQADQVVKAVDGAITAGKLATASRQTFIDLGKRDFTSLTTMLAAMPAIPGLNGQSAAAGAAAADGGGGDGGGTGALTTQQNKIAAQLGIDPKAYQTHLAAVAAAAA